jgi:hypothetical protein
MITMIVIGATLVFQTMAYMKQFMMNIREEAEEYEWEEWRLQRKTTLVSRT